MPSISVAENITKMSSALDRMRGELTAHEREMYRLEGMLSVFRNLNELGVTEIPVNPPNLKTIPDNEVLDGAPVVQSN